MITNPAVWIKEPSSRVGFHAMPSTMAFQDANVLATEGLRTRRFDDSAPGTIGKPKEHLEITIGNS